jgi:dienelactone hydrolase
MMARAMLCAAMLAGIAPAQTTDFSAPGSCGWTFRTEDIQGTTEMMAGSRIYFPDSSGKFPGSAVPAPIVVFGHGWQMGIDRYYSYAAHLAAWGYVVVMPTISDPLVNPEHVKRAQLMVDAAKFVAALDTVAGDRFEGRLDRWNWGFAGHSMGGSIALLAADTFNLYDTLRCVVALGSPQTDPPTHSAHLFRPKLLLPGGTDNIAPWRDVRAAFWADAPAPGTFAVIHGANHGSYMDFSRFWENRGTALITREAQQAICRRHMTAFFERYLRGDSSAWNFSYTYGDSILHHATMDSVEVRLPPVAVAEPFVSLGDVSSGPNPVRGRAVIRYGLPVPGPASLSVFDSRGGLVRKLAAHRTTAVVGYAYWDGADSAGVPAASGIYVVRLTSAGFTGTTTPVLVQ